MLLKYMIEKSASITECAKSAMIKGRKVAPSIYICIQKISLHNLANPRNIKYFPVIGSTSLAFLITTNCGKSPALSLYIVKLTNTCRENQFWLPGWKKNANTRHVDVRLYQFKYCGARWTRVCLNL